MKHFVILFFCFLILANARVLGQSEVIDGVAAVVNNDVITYSQVRDLVGARERALRNTYRGEELANKVKEMRSAALKDLIDRQLILQEFKKKGYSIPPHIIDDQVQVIIRREFGGDRAAFVRTLKAQGYTLTKFKQIERDKFIVLQMRRAQLRDDFVVSPTQVQQFYEKNKASYSTPEQVKLRMLVLREGDSAEATGLEGGKLAMAKEIRAKLRSGAEFDRMAQMYSEDADTQESGGDWGWIERNTLNKELSDVAFSLRAGEISDVIQIGSSYYILMVEARKNAQVKPISEVRKEIEQNLLQQEQQKELQRWLDTLRQKAYIKIYS